MVSLVLELLVLASVTSFHPVDVNAVSYLRRLLGARDPPIFLPGSPPNSASVRGRRPCSADVLPP
jgi:hypothetical protein